MKRSLVLITSLSLFFCGCYTTKIYPIKKEVVDRFIKIESEPSGADFYSIHPISLEEDAHLGVTPLTVKLNTAEMEYYEGLVYPICKKISVHVTGNINNHLYNWSWQNKTAKSDALYSHTISFRIKLDGYTDENFDYELLLNVADPKTETKKIILKQVN